MAFPVKPTDEINLLPLYNSETYNVSTNPYGMADGGHITNWPPALEGMSVLAQYASDVAVEMDLVADQVALDAAAAAGGSGTESTVVNIRAGTSAQYVSIRNIYSASAFVALTDAASIALDMATGINFEVTLGAAGRTLANPTNKVSGKSGIIIFTQDGTGNRSVTDWGSDYVWIGDEPVWPTTAGAETIVSYICRSNGNVLLSYGGSTS